jgi:pyrroloquinoline quinone biosynthesis protein D
VGRLILDATTCPRLPRGVRLARDAEGRAVLLAPERVVVLDDEARAILALADGARPVAAIADALAAEYDAERDAILADVTALLQELADRGFVVA